MIFINKNQMKFNKCRPDIYTQNKSIAIKAI